MKKQPKKTPREESQKDRLSSRPDEGLPTTLDPAGPEARGYPLDPKRTPPDGKHEPDDPDADADEEYTA